MKRAAEALGLPPALVEKLLPGILGQLPGLGQAALQVSRWVNTVYEEVHLNNS